MLHMSAMIPLVVIFVALYLVLRRKPRARTENLEPIKSVLGFRKRG
ncbi:MAG: hypothetical protein JW802_06865 [Campylobacterales bacterium]|nr:hypothetical protein [Campylobacterales bacterium]